MGGYAGETTTIALRLTIVDKARPFESNPRLFARIRSHIGPFPSPTCQGGQLRNASLGSCAISTPATLLEWAAPRNTSPGVFPSASFTIALVRILNGS